MSRRTFLRSLAAGGVGAAGAAALGLSWRKLTGRHPTQVALRVPNRISRENRAPGSTSWTAGANGTRAANDKGMQIKGYASTTSAVLGSTIDFHVTVAEAEPFTIDLYRLGWYGGQGARHLVASSQLPGTQQAPPSVDAATGMISCDWASSWSTHVPADWTPGLYLAAFTTKSGWRSFTPFVVRDQHRVGGLCVVMPFTTYQAYNQWPYDGVTGKDLYYGFGADGKRVSANSASQVSFDRPYYMDGLPKLFADDRTFVQWVEQAQYDVNYATSVDIESGALDASAYRGIVFAGHDEYWSPNMREWAAKAFAGGTSLAFLGANNVYWPISFGAAVDGRTHRQIVCNKYEFDPVTGVLINKRWRDPSPGMFDPEQAQIGVQYNGIVKGEAPLIVKAADHWIWAGCDVADGDQIQRLIGVEADGLNAGVPTVTGVTQTLLSASPYTDTYGVGQVQNTSILETPDGPILFVAGTLAWTRGLGAKGYKDARIIQATKNVFNRMLA